MSNAAPYVVAGLVGVYLYSKHKKNKEFAEDKALVDELIKADPTIDEDTAQKIKDYPIDPYR